MMPTRHIGALLLSTALISPAAAEISPEQALDMLLQDNRAFMETVEIGSQRREGDTLIVENISSSGEIEGGSSFNIVLPELRLQAINAETVDMSIPQPMIGSVKLVIENDESLEIAFSYREEAGSTRITGSPENARYSFKAEELSFEGEMKAAGDATAGSPEISVTYNISGPTGEYQRIVNDAQEIAYSIQGQAPLMTTSLSISGEEGDEVFRVDGEQIGREASFSGAVAVPNLEDAPDLFENGFGAMIAAGFGFDINASFGSTTGDFTFAGPDMPEATLQMQTGSYEVSYGATEEGLNLESALNDAQVDVTGLPIPLPVSVKLQEFTSNLQMPLSVGEEAQEASFAYKLGGFEVNKEVWALFDPRAVLPRDPANLEIAFDSRLALLQDIFDPEVGEKLGESGEMPVRLDQARLNTLLLELAGAKLTGEGQAEFDNTSGTEPIPTGTARFQLDGAHTLLDRLVEIGLVPSEQLLQIRMSLGLFTRQEGEDTLVSEVEFSPDALVVNGTQLR